MKELIAAQRQYFNSGITRDVGFRKAMLTRLEGAILRHEADLLAALKADLNKSAFEGYATELGVLLGEVRYARRHVSRWARAKRAAMPLAQFPSRGRIHQEPYGVALILAPWNYPVQLTLSPLLSAIAAGCCAVVKPSEHAPASSQAVARLIEEVFPRAYIAAVEGGQAETQALLEECFDCIFFTGSTRVGKLVMGAAAEHLTPVTLELGGKSPVIVAPDADLDLAAKRIVWGKFLNAGQTCVAPDHVWVTADRRDALAAAMGKYITQFYGAHPLEGQDLPRLIHQQHFQRLCRFLEEGTIAIGGESDAAALRIAPTVLTDVTEASGVMGEEIFGPILPLLTYDNLDELVAHLREKPKALALYLFTQSKTIETQVMEGLSFGGGCVNDTIVHVAVGGLPFGGVGESGMGTCHGKAGFDAFTHQKSILKKGRLDVPIRYAPFSDEKIRLLKKLM